MNRVIKFRAWDDRLKIMHNDVNPFRWDFVIKNTWHKCEKSNGTGMLGSGGNEAEMLVPAVSYTHINQFTGLVGKNKTDLFDGDIYEHNGKKFVVIISDNCGTCSVEANKHYDLGMTVIKNENNRRDFMDIYNIQKYITVIGNIHENPELI